MAATLSYICELVEGEENKLTTFSTWTIMLGCNESNIIFQQHQFPAASLHTWVTPEKQWYIILQQHLCKLGQLRRSNGRNSKYSVKQ